MTQVSVKKFRIRLARITQISIFAISSRHSVKLNTSVLWQF